MVPDLGSKIVCNVAATSVRRLAPGGEATTFLVSAAPPPPAPKKDDDALDSDVVVGLVVVGVIVGIGLIAGFIALCVILCRRRDRRNRRGMYNAHNVRMAQIEMENRQRFGEPGKGKKKKKDRSPAVEFW